MCSSWAASEALQSEYWLHLIAVWVQSTHFWLNEAIPYYRLIVTSEKRFLWPVFGFESELCCILLLIKHILVLIFNWICVQKTIFTGNGFFDGIDFWTWLRSWAKYVSTQRMVIILCKTGPKRTLYWLFYWQTLNSFSPINVIIIGIKIKETN